MFSETSLCVKASGHTRDCIFCREQAVDSVKWCISDWGSGVRAALGGQRLSALTEEQQKGIFVSNFLSLLKLKLKQSALADNMFIFQFYGWKCKCGRLNGLGWVFFADVSASGRGMWRSSCSPWWLFVTEVSHLSRKQAENEQKRGSRVYESNI